MSWINHDKKIVNVTEMMDFITPHNFNYFYFLPMF